MYVAYLREDETYDYEIVDRRGRLHLSLSFPDESVWRTTERTGDHLRL